MAIPQHQPLRPLTIAEQATLTRIVKASSERADRMRRARALLAVAQGASFSQAARTAGFYDDRGVAKLVARFQQRGLAALDIAGGLSRPPNGRRIAASMARQPGR